MDASRFGGPYDRPQIVGIFNPIQNDDQWRFGSPPGGLQHVLGFGVGFGGDEPDDALVSATRHHAVQGMPGLDMDGNVELFGQFNDVRQAPIMTGDHQPKERARSGTQGLTDGVRPVNQLGRLSASICWSHLDDPQS
jgi:hypothetical protein